MSMSVALALQMAESSVKKQVSKFLGMHYKYSITCVDAQIFSSQDLTAIINAVSTCIMFFEFVSMSHNTHAGTSGGVGVTPNLDPK